MQRWDMSYCCLLRNWRKIKAPREAVVFFFAGYWHGCRKVTQLPLEHVAVSAVFAVNIKFH